MHPVVYVNSAVDLAQQERQATDPLSFSDPGSVDNSDGANGRIFLQLGFDPNLFVQEAVRGSQGVSRFLGNIVNGRLDRLYLSSDRSLPTPGLQLMDTEFETVQRQMELDALNNAQPGQTSVANPADSADLPHDYLAAAREQFHAAAPPARDIAPAVNKPQHANPTALSFTAQLKKGSSSLPLASRSAQAAVTV